MEALVEAHAEECGDLDFQPPELARLHHSIGSMMALATQHSETTAVGLSDCRLISGWCDLGTCGHDGACICAEGMHGPRCSLRGPAPPIGAPPLSTFLVLPTGDDSDSCGGEASPCRTLQQALRNQQWHSLQSAPGTEPASITLGDGVFSGEGNGRLYLHGGRVEIRSANGPHATIVDCTQLAGRSGSLFVSGESDAVTVRDLSLRRCHVEQQTQHAVAPHPKYAAHVAGSSGWSGARQGVRWISNRWLAG